MFRIDTHIHSTFSDGTLTPAEVVSIAADEGLGLFALTDHNILSGNIPFAECVRERRLRALAGAEITTGYPGREIHLLSYFPLDSDFSSEKFRKLTTVLDRIRERKKINNRETVGKLSADFPQVSYEEFIEYASRSGKECSNFNRMNIAAYLVEKGILSTPQEGFSTILKDGGKYYRSSEKEDLLEMVKTVSDCGGFPSVAHLGEYEDKLSQETMQQMLYDISDVTNEFGVELFHYKHTEERRNRYMEMCGKVDAKIIFTAGSDCHGTRKPNRIGYPYETEPGPAHMELYEEVSRTALEFFRKKGMVN